MAYQFFDVGNDGLISEKREYVFTEINLEGDAVTDRLQTVMTVVNGDGSRTEPLVNKLGQQRRHRITVTRNYGNYGGITVTRHSFDVTCPLP